MRRTIVDEVDARILPSLLCWGRAETMKHKFSDGASANYLLDESGVGNHFGSAGGNTPPLMVYDDCNGYASVNFTGAMDIRGSMVHTSTVRGAFAIVKHNTAGNWKTAVGEGFITDLASGQGMLAGAADTINVRLGTATDTAYVNGVQTIAITNTDAWNLLYIEFTAAAKSYTATVLGRQGGTAAFLNGRLAEWGYFGGLPSAQVRTAFLAALIAKYAITGNV